MQRKTKIINEIKLDIVGYEFPDDNGDIYTRNWLVVEYSFIYDGVNICNKSVDLLSFELMDFLNNLKKALNNDVHTIICLYTIEPFLNIKVILKEDINTIDLSYTFFYKNDLENVQYIKDYTKEELQVIIEKYERELSAFPYRQIITNEKVVSYNELKAYLKKYHNSIITNIYTNYIELTFNDKYLNIYDAYSFDDPYPYINVKEAFGDEYFLAYIKDITLLEDILSGKKQIKKEVKRKKTKYIIC